jgi:hypothetical protein
MKVAEISGWGRPQIKCWRRTHGTMEAEDDRSGSGHQAFRGVAFNTVEEGGLPLKCVDRGYIYLATSSFK